MKNLTVNYDILGKTDKKILVLADFHSLSLEKALSLAKAIQEEDSDLIILAGDIMQGPRYRDKKSLESLKRFLSQISENSPVVLEKGNHDLVGYDEESRKGYLSLEEARPGMVMPLDNSAVTVDGMRIVGVCPGRPAFAPSLQESGAALTYFAKDWLGSELGKETDPDLFNILICHNPKIFAQALSIAEHSRLSIPSEILEDLKQVSHELSKFDLCAAGHLHNGYLPLEIFLKNPDKYMDLGIWEMPMEKNSHEGIKLIRPWVFKKTDLCRGVVYVGPERDRIIQLPNDHFYYQDKPYSKPLLVDRSYSEGKIPVVISGGVNKFFNLPVDAAEITRANVKKLIR